MCGFFGFVDFDGQASAPDYEEVRKGAEAIRYRGPDDFGFTADRHHSIGFCRLSIIDLSAPSQPFTNNAKTLTMVCNGEIYNFRALRDILTSKGHTFRTNTDSEVVLHGYEEWKDELWPKLKGIFAIVLWDANAKKLFLVRDHLGVKPIHYMRIGARVYFGSDYNAFFHQTKVSIEPNTDAILSYTSFRYVIGEKSFYKGILDVLPGNAVEFTPNNEKRPKVYWDIPTDTGEDKGEAYYLERLDEKLRQSVEEQLMSDVPLGAFISGGLDSSLLLHYMHSEHKDIRSFATGFEEDGYNEFQYVDVIADHLGIEPTKIFLNAEEYMENMDEVIGYRGEPASIPHEAGFLKMSKIMKDQITVVLSGEGADEMFGGYGRIFRSPFDFLKQNLVNSKFNIFGSLLGKCLNVDPATKFQSPQEHFLSRYSWFTNQEKSDLLNMEYFEHRSFDEYSQNFISQLFGHVRDKTYSRGMYYLQGKLHLPNLLNRLDRMTMAASIEARVPFLDHEFVEFVSRIPLHYKLRWNNTLSRIRAIRMDSNRISEKLDTPKFILKRLAQGKIPESVIWREKMGFPVPLDLWFNKKMRTQALEMLTDSKAKIRDFINVDGIRRLLERKDFSSYYDYDGKKIWMLMNLEMWMRKYFPRKESLI